MERQCWTEKCEFVHIEEIFVKRGGRKIVYKRRKEEFDYLNKLRKNLYIGKEGVIRMFS